MKETTEIILISLAIILINIVNIMQTNQIKDLQYCLNTPLNERDEERCR